MNYSILEDSKRVKFDKIAFLEKFDSTQYKLVTIQKPEVDIESIQWFGKIQQAKQKSVDKKLEKYAEDVKSLTNMVCESVVESLTEQEKILLEMDKNLRLVRESLISKQKLDEVKGDK